MQILNYNLKPRKRRGGVVVEFAIVFPIIMLFFAAMMEITRVLLMQHTVDTAAYEGARRGMVPGVTAAEAYDAAEELTRIARLRSVKITVTPEVIEEKTSLVTVRVAVPVAENSWITPRWLARYPVVSEVTLFCERPPMIQLTGVPGIKVKNSKTHETEEGL